ncbi:unnamed protein product [Polarella glacialis]|uniref:Sphingomyelin synthase-like domain-containing protein n=1 Tax=Polarella glacialis TaxID=89957 RepID=A0A813DFQ3_POLGL|nr:unnamed protein product [Polarella glacialis]|mmetsp:Transcript_25602/g.45407  ORF Transcript_25602/g.45407 Transcript_25602/m.45407 type:complete len:375 (-) Transcript_25602:105-1229(-)
MAVSSTSGEEDHGFTSEESSSEDEEEEEELGPAQQSSKAGFFAYHVGADGKTPSFFSDPFCVADFRKPALLQFLPRVAAAAAIFAFGLYVNNVSQAWLQQNMAGYYEKNWVPVPPVNTTVILWDVTFASLPYVKSTKPADAFAGGAPMFVMLRFFVVPGPRSLRWTILCRWLVMWGILWFGRAFTIISTPLPNPDPTCVPKISFPDNIFLEAWANLPIVPMYPDELTCQDVLYSGHTVALTLNTMVILKYIRTAPWFPSNSSTRWCSTSTVFNVLGVVMLLMGYYFIVASHFHYTIDVLVGAVMTVLVFNMYHFIIKVSMLRKRKSRLCISPFFRWLERPAKDLKCWRRRAAEVLAQLHHDDDIIHGLENGVLN